MVRHLKKSWKPPHDINFPSTVNRDIAHENRRMWRGKYVWKSPTDLQCVMLLSCTVCYDFIRSISMIYGNRVSERNGLWNSANERLWSSFHIQSPNGLAIYYIPFILYHITGLYLIKVYMYKSFRTVRNNMRKSEFIYKEKKSFHC